MEGNPSGQDMKFWRKIIQQMRNVKDNTITIVYTNQELNNNLIQRDKGDGGDTAQ